MGITEGDRYSFAKTPLKAAQAPLAAARASQDVLPRELEGDDGETSSGEAGVMTGGRRGSAWVSMAAGGVFVNVDDKLCKRAARRMEIA